MSDDLENVNFSRYSLDIGLVFDLVLLQYLDGYFFAGDQMRSQSHCTKSALAQRSTYERYKKYWISLINIQ